MLRRAPCPTLIPRPCAAAVQALIVTLMPALVWAGPVDINTADAATIAKELQGIGLSRAQAIVAYREKNGAFRSADDLRKIKGIGAKVLERNRANIKVGQARRKAAVARMPERARPSDRALPVFRVSSRSCEHDGGAR